MGWLSWFAGDDDLSNLKRAMAHQGIADGAVLRSEYAKRPRPDGTSSEEETDANAEVFVKRLRNGAKIK